MIAIKPARIYILLSFLLLRICSSAFSNTAFHVSPNGSDSNPGTLQMPFKTIERARDVVRKINQAMKGDIIVFLHGGEYLTEKTIIFGHADSGNKNFKIIYRAYENEKPVFTGGVMLGDWEAMGNGIWKTNAKGLNFRQLYVNDRRAIRARQPNSDNNYFLKAWDVANHKIIVDAGQISLWRNFQQVEMVLHQEWAESYLRLKSFTTHGTVSNRDAYISLQDEESKILFPRPYPQKNNGQVFHFENALEFLDEVGEWYLDTKASEVYYKPHVHENMATLQVIAPQVETLLKVEGTLEKPVRNLVFEGIRFQHTTWMRPSEHGYLNMQAGQYNISADSSNNQYGDRPPAGVTVIASENILFVKNHFMHMGSTGIDFFYGTKDCSIIGNIVKDISGNGISVGKFFDNRNTEYHVPYNPKDKREVCTNDRVSNNVIYRTGRDYYGTCAIAAGYPAGIKIEHNLITDNPYTGISVGYGWTKQPNAMMDNVIARNDISNVMNLMADGGGIYTLSFQPGTTISENYIHQIVRSKWAGKWAIAGIYSDEATGGTNEKPFVIERNVFDESMQQKFHTNLAGKIVLDNNYLYNAPKEIIENAGLQNDYKKIIPDDFFYKTVVNNFSTRDIVFTTDLKDDPKVIEKYKFLHSANGVWPEVVSAANTSGIQKIKIYLQGNRLIMIITIPADADMNKIDVIYKSSSPKIKEWADLMSTFQQSPPGAAKGQIWVPMELIHNYENGKVR